MKWRLLMLMKVWYHDARKAVRWRLRRHFGWRVRKTPAPIARILGNSLVALRENAKTPTRGMVLGHDWHAVQLPHRDFTEEQMQQLREAHRQAILNGPTYS